MAYIIRTLAVLALVLLPSFAWSRRYYWLEHQDGVEGPTIVYNEHGTLFQVPADEHQLIIWCGYMLPALTVALWWTFERIRRRAAAASDIRAEQAA